MAYGRCGRWGHLGRMVNLELREVLPSEMGVYQILFLKNWRWLRKIDGWLRQ